MFKHIKRDKAFYKTMLLLALPLVLQNVISQSLVLIDNVMVGRVSETALAGVFIATAPINIVVLLVFGIQSGMMVMMTQYHGRNDHGSINRIFGISLMITVMVTLFFSAACFVFPKQIIRIWTDEAHLIDVAVRFIRIVGISLVFSSISILYSGMQRSVGNVKFGLWLESFAAICNTVLGYTLIFGHFGAPAMGIEGAAIATLISRVLQFFICIIFATRAKNLPLEYRKIIAPGMKMLKDFFKYAMQVVINELLWITAMSIYVAVFGRLGPTTVAAYAIIRSVEYLVLIIAVSFGNASLVMIGKEVGAGNPTEAYKIGVTTLWISLLVGIASMILFYFAKPLIYVMYRVKPETKALTDIFMGMMIISIPLRSILFNSIVGILRGGGDVRAALLIDTALSYFLGIPLAFIFAFWLKFPPYFVYGAMLFEFTVKSIICIWWVYKGKWIKNLTRVQG